MGEERTIKTASLQELPNEILHMILDRVPTENYTQLYKVNRTFRDLTMYLAEQKILRPYSHDYRKSMTLTFVTLNNFPAFCKKVLQFHRWKIDEVMISLVVSLNDIAMLKYVLQSCVYVPDNYIKHHTDTFTAFKFHCPYAESVDNIEATEVLLSHDIPMSLHDQERLLQRIIVKGDPEVLERLLTRGLFEHLHSQRYYVTRAMHYVSSTNQDRARQIAKLLIHYGFVYELPYKA